MFQSVSVRECLEVFGQQTRISDCKIVSAKVSLLTLKYDFLYSSRGSIRNVSANIRYIQFIFQDAIALKKEHNTAPSNQMTTANANLDIWVVNVMSQTIMGLLQRKKLSAKIMSNRIIIISSQITTKSVKSRIETTIITFGKESVAK